jgi:bifunctional non-homologous end joining protein LigD
LARSGLRCFAKTSGSKGLQVYVPLNSGVSYSETKPLSHEIALNLEKKHPSLVVSDMKKTLREGKVLVDWSQNDEHKTTISVYSLRARPHPTVSTPVTWAEVSRCLQSGDRARLEFTAPQVLERVERHSDLFAPVLSLHQQLPQSIELGVGVSAIADAERPARQRAASRETSREAKAPPTSVRPPRKRASSQRSA